MPVSLEDAWSFFSTPKNLPLIAPEDMGFKIISKHHGDTIYAGQIIEYTISPVFGIPLYWMTEITHVEHEKYFVDEQRYGPYGMWHHQHHFMKVNGGVEMTDIVHYKIPFWFFGDIVNKLFVAKKLASIFEYRRLKISERFGVL